MNDISTSLILLLVAIAILWLAVTDKLGRLIDAFNVVEGKETATTATATGMQQAAGNNTASVTIPAMLPGMAPITGTVHLPSIPPNGQFNNVPL